MYQSNTNLKLKAVRNCPSTDIRQNVKHWAEPITHKTFKKTDERAACLLQQIKKSLSTGTNVADRIRRIHMFLGLPDPDPLVRNTVRIRLHICLSSSKNSKKTTLIPIDMWLLYDFLSLKNDVNVPSKSKKQKNLEDKILLLLTSWSRIRFRIRIE